jgi:hypothetical protein
VVADETGPGGYGVYAHASRAQDGTRYNPIGVYGFDGVLGTADSGIAVHAHNSSDTAAALQAENDSSESDALAFRAEGGVK